MSRITPYARTAWAEGVASLGACCFPVHPEVAESMKAAVLAAELHEDHPGVLEAVRREARRTALFHVLDARRDVLEARWMARLRPILRRVADLVAPIIAHALVPAVAPDRMESVTEDVAQPSNTQQTAQTALNGIVDSQVYADWRDVTREAYQEALAEGDVQGAAYVADLMNRALPVFDLRFVEALDAIRASDDITAANLAAWMHDQTYALAYQLGPRLADGIDAGASYADLRDIVGDVFSTDFTGADLMLGYTMGRGVSEGALALYASEGLLKVDLLITASACPICESTAMQNPWPLDDPPECPQHPRCRCSLAPSFGE